MGLPSDIFRMHGRFCAEHPWEVIFVVLSATVCIISTGVHGSIHLSLPADGNVQPEALDIVLMTLVRSVAVLYSYHRLRSLHRSHSRFVLGLAGVFTVFSSFVFTCSVVNVLQSDLSDLKDALFFFLLLIDVAKACALAHWCLSCSVCGASEVASCISQGMAVLGPAITLDTLVEALVIGIGTLSGVRRLEVLCCYGCMSAVVNYVVFMTFYPACLSLVLELSGIAGAQSDDSSITKADGKATHPTTDPLMVQQSQWQQKVKLLKQMMALEQPNPVVQRVKLIMAAGLMIVHAHCRWVFLHENRVGDDGNSISALESPTVTDFDTDASVLRWLSLRADQLVLLILVLALTVKFTFFDDRHENVHNKMNVQTLSFSCSNPALSSHILPGIASTATDVVRNSRTRSISVVVGDDSDDSDAFCMVEDKEVQTEENLETLEYSQPLSSFPLVNVKKRSLEECIQIYQSELGAESLTDEEVLDLVASRHIAAHQLEKVLNNTYRGVHVRRLMLAKVKNSHLPEALQQVPYNDYDYSKVFGVCCENVIGFVPLPVGVAGPLIVDDLPYYIPMATTEGCLVASTNRGCRALSNGVRTQLVADGMSRGPVVRLPNIARASEVMGWLDDPSHIELVKTSFNSTSRFARLQKIRIQNAGRHLFMRFVAKTGDAMGMNMVSKGTEKALRVIQGYFPDLEIVSLSGNFCTDKKAAAVNWLEGRGKSVVSEAIIPSSVVEKILKTSVSALVDLNTTKNLIGSSVAGSIGGFNAHAANIVAAIFIATGQDPAQVVTSSNCMTLMEPWGPSGEDLYISCTMPSLEIGTVGGGTGLPAQSSCLQMLGVQGPNLDKPGENAGKLARIVCATVLAGELSLMGALAAGHLVKSHMTHNRSSYLLAPQCNSPS